MIVFLDAVSHPGYIALYDKDRKQKASLFFDIHGNETKLLLDTMMNFLASNQCQMSDIEHIICVCGPGSFTGIRTITLIINSLAYAFPHIFLTGISYFDLFREYPILKQSSKRDVFVKKSKDAIILCEAVSCLLEQYQSVPMRGDVQFLGFSLCTPATQDDYERCIRDVFLKDTKKIAPLYLKNPNIS